MTDRTNQKITLSDGRRLGFAEYGAPGGKPVFYFHGYPGSRLEWPGFDEGDLATKLNARIIAADRPGFGLSDFKRGREILDWPDDVIALANALGIGKFAVLGISGGGPYACACAVKRSERITAISIVAGMGPPDAPGCRDGLSWSFAGKRGIMRRLMLMLTSFGARTQPSRFALKAIASMTGPDRELMNSKPQIMGGIVDTFAEALRPGVAGVYHETDLYMRPWGFRLRSVNAKIHLWHGEQDHNVPISVGRFVADALPNCEAKFIADEGHLSLISKYIESYLGVLV